MHYIIHNANVKATWKQACAGGIQKQPGQHKTAACGHTGMLDTIGPRMLILLVSAAHGLRDKIQNGGQLCHATSRLVHREKKNARKALSAKTKRSCMTDNARAVTDIKHHTFQRRHPTLGPLTVCTLQRRHTTQQGSSAWHHGLPFGEMARHGASITSAPCFCLTGYSS